MTGRVTRRGRTLHVNRTCGHNEECHIGTCSDARTREAATREAEKLCRYCQVELDTATRRAAFNALSPEDQQRKREKDRADLFD